MLISPGASLGKMIRIRAYRDGDETELRNLFTSTIRKICNRDYTAAEIDAWAPCEYDKERWRKRIQGIDPFIATMGEEIVGYADVQDDGYIDHFYCHHSHQRQGIGRALMSAISDRANDLGIARLYTYASITAKPFFERFGFKVVESRQIAIGAEKLTNYLMECAADESISI